MIFIAENPNFNSYTSYEYCKMHLTLHILSATGFESSSWHIGHELPASATCAGEGLCPYF